MPVSLSLQVVDENGAPVDLPLSAFTDVPVGAATDAKLDEVVAAVEGISPTDVSGLATAAGQATGNAALASIVAALADPATDATLSEVLAKLPSSPPSAADVQAVSAALAQTLMVESSTLTPRGYDQQPVTTAAALEAVPAQATKALIRTNANVRWRDDGTNPTTTVGMQIPAGGELFYDGDLAAFAVVSESGTATLDIAYYS